jgi:hypothetical protein
MLREEERDLQEEVAELQRELYERQLKQWEFFVQIGFDRYLGELKEFLPAGDERLETAQILGQRVWDQQWVVTTKQIALVDRRARIAWKLGTWPEQLRQDPVHSATSSEPQAEDADVDRDASGMLAWDVLQRLCVEYAVYHDDKVEKLQGLGLRLQDLAVLLTMLHCQAGLLPSMRSATAFDQHMAQAAQNSGGNLQVFFSELTAHLERTAEVEGKPGKPLGALCVCFTEKRFNETAKVRVCMWLVRVCMWLV